MISWIISAAFQFHFMTLAINFIDRCGPSNEMCSQLQSKKIKVMLYYPFIKQKRKKFYPPFITYKTKHINFKSICVIWVVKHLKGDRFIMLHKQLWLKTTLYCCFITCAEVLSPFKFKCVNVTMGSLVMSPFSHDYNISIGNV